MKIRDGSLLSWSTVTAETSTQLKGKKRVEFSALRNARISWEASWRDWDTSISEIWFTAMWKLRIFYFWQTQINPLDIVPRYAILVFVDRTTTTSAPFAEQLTTWHPKSSEKAYTITRWMYGPSACSCFACCSEIFLSKVSPLQLRHQYGILNRI